MAGRKRKYPEHGTPQRYDLRRDPCRCKPCTDAFTAYVRDYKLRAVHAEHMKLIGKITPTQYITIVRAPSHAYYQVWGTINGQRVCCDFGGLEFLIHKYPKATVRIV